MYFHVNNSRLTWVEEKRGRATASTAWDWNEWIIWKSSKGAFIHKARYYYPEKTGVGWAGAASSAELLQHEGRRWPCQLDTFFHPSSDIPNEIISIISESSQVRRRNTKPCLMCVPAPTFSLGSHPQRPFSSARGRRGQIRKTIVWTLSVGGKRSS